MGAEADSVCGAGYGERTEDRVNSRNGYRDRPWDARVGSIELRVPKLRTGSARRAALTRWLHIYNHHRHHTAIGGPPSARVTNLSGQYT